MRLVSDWKQAWYYYSTLAMALAGAAQITWISIPDDLRSSVPSDWMAYATTALMVLGIFGRTVRQK